MSEEDKNVQAFGVPTVVNSKVYQFVKFIKERGAAQMAVLLCFIGCERI